MMTGCHIEGSNDRFAPEVCNLFLLGRTRSLALLDGGFQNLSLSGLQTFILSIS